MTYPITQYAAVGAFRCLGADCPDTCCRGWDMPADARQRDLYAEKAPELLATIDPQQGIMRRAGEGQQCAQLCGGSCSIHTRFGEEFLGDACYFYPRLMQRMGDHYTMSGAISCPEMLRLMLAQPRPFDTQPVAVPRLPTHRRDLVPEGMTQAQCEAAHAQAMRIAADSAATPEAIMEKLYAFALNLAGEPDDATAAEAKPSDAHALYYALALTEAFGTPGISTHLAQVMGVMAQQLDCRFDRTAREFTLGDNAAKAYHTLTQRWQMDARAALAPTLRRWIQAQLAMTYFPFGGFSDISMAGRAAILVQRFATIRLALMCHVTADGIPPDESAVIRIIQPIARFMDHLADAKLTMMIHRDTGWTTSARLRGLVVG